MSGHCAKHCAEDCGIEGFHFAEDGAFWWPDHRDCPACAEREQIEWLLDDLADYADDHGQIHRRNILDGVRRQIQDGAHRNGGDA